MRILAQNFGEQTEQLNRTAGDLERANAEVVKYREKETEYSDTQKALAAQAKQLAKMEKVRVGHAPSGAGRHLRSRLKSYPPPPP